MEHPKLRMKNGHVIQQHSNGRMTWTDERGMVITDRPLYGAERLLLDELEALTKIMQEALCRATPSAAT